MAVKAVKKAASKPAESEAASTQPKKAKGKLKLILIVLLLAGGAGGGAYWYLNQGSGASKPQAAKPPVFQALENFTVNLQIEDNPQFLQTGITLKVADSAAVDAIKQRMPEVRNTVLLLLSGRKASEILTVEGKRKLGVDIAVALNAIFDPVGAQSVPTAKPPAPPPDAAASPATAPATTPATPTDPATATEPATPPDNSEEPAADAEVKPRVTVLDVLFTLFIIQ